MKNTIVITIHQGAVSDVTGIPKGTRVEIHDFDSIEGVETHDDGTPYDTPLEFKKDEDGDWYEVFVFDEGGRQ